MQIFGKYAFTDNQQMAARQARLTEWIYFVHPPRDDFSAIMTDDERAVWAAHFARLQRLLAAGQLILHGPTLGLMADDPAISSGYARGELRPFRVALALERPDGLAPVVSAFLARGELADHPLPWADDGRITAGHPAVLRDVAAAGPLEVTLVDGLTDAGWSWSQRDEAMARRVLAARAAGTGTLVVAGNAHTPVQPTPLGAVIASRRPGVREIRIDDRSGGYYNLAPRRFRPRTGSRRLYPALVLRNENLTLILPSATEAAVPQQRCPPAGP